MAQGSDDILALLELIAREKIQELKRPVRIALAGAQGSGKSTVARSWVTANPKVAHFSLDDIYLATAERKALAASVSTLFKVRGPPGTHDLDLGTRTLMKLHAARARDRTPLPRFDKLKDARIPAEQWPNFEGTANVVLVDGWCMGALPEEDPDLLAVPINALEESEDTTAAWRNHANTQLAGPYQKFFDRFDVFVFLAAPDFGVVERWRLEQEAELRGVALDKLELPIRANIARFVRHYERITRSMLEGRVRANWIVKLDETRAAVDIEGPF